MKLAMALHRTRRELLASIDSHELALWQAYDTIEPFGPWRDDLRAGTIASAALAPHMKKGKKRPSPTDFIPKFTAEPRKRRSPKEIERKLLRITAMAGGKITPAKPAKK